jgi:recombination protein RecA
MDKKKSLEITIGALEKQYGKGTIMRLGDFEPRLYTDSISTSSLALDLATGIGGVPRGRVIEIFGPESSGKTTLALQIVSEAQQAGGLASYIDVEHALDPDYAKNIGVDVDNLYIAQPDTGEQALEIVDALVRSNAIDVVVVDSVAALVPKAEIEGEMGDSFMGLQARLMSQALRKLTGSISKSGTCAIFINQIREKIGIVYGNPETTPGGRALKFYASMRIDIRRVDNIKVGNDIIGNRVKAKIVKNKLAPPFKQVEFDIIYGKGISKVASVIDVAIEKGIITRSGSWYNYGDVKLGQGQENMKSYLEENEKILKEIIEKTKKEAMKSLAAASAG